MKEATIREGPLRGAMYNGWSLGIMLCYGLEDGKLGERGRHAEDGKLLSG